MWLELKQETSTPLSRQIYEGIKALILHGDLKAEEKLPSSRTLSKDLNVARNTVLEAYDQLLAEGYLDSRHGSGTTVAKGIAATARQPKPGNSPFTPPDRFPREEGIINFRSGIPTLETFPQHEWGKLY